LTGYIVRRTIQACIVVIAVSMVVFLAVHLLPGGAARATLGPQATAVQLRQFNVANGYNLPLWDQYLQYARRLLSGNLGYAYSLNESVSRLLAQDLPKTALLVALAYLLAIVIGVPLGVWQALHRDRAGDHAFTAAAFIGYSMPAFWLGLLLILFFSIDMHVFPPEAPQGVSVGQILAHPLGLVLPVVTLAVVTFAGFSRFARSSVIDNLAEEYVRTARAKGLRPWLVLTHHLLRNSMLPLIGIIGLTLPTVVSGAIVIEQVFNYPGMGLLLWNAAISRDYPTLLGATLVVSVATVAGSLLADVLYAIADPRIRY
jgi:peptide/nickel transport system permease protein